MGKTYVHGCWWSVDDELVPGEVTKRVAFLDQQNLALREDTIFYLNVFSNFNVDGQGASSAPFYFQLSDKKIRNNITVAAIDTAASLIASGRTMPVYLTTGGDYRLSRRSQQRSKVLHSQFYDLGVFRMGVDVFYDGATTGTGCAYGYIDPNTGCPGVERVMPNSLYVDAAEGRAPRSIYRVRFIARDVLAAVYEGQADAIADSAGPTGSDFETFFMRPDNRADMVRVIEAWHLPTMDGMSDGKYVMCTDNATLVSKPWTRNRFPFAFYRYVQRRAGFFGQGLMERVLPAQIRMAELQRRIDRAQDQCTMPKYLIEENSNVRAEDIDNLEGTAVYYQQTKPELVVWQGTPPELVSQLETISNDVFAQEGLSPGMIGGELVQKGLNSARAVRASDDIASRRLIIPTEELQEFYLAVAKLLEDLNDECAEADPEYTVTSRSRVGNRNFLSSSKWRDLDLPPNDVRINMFPMAATPTTYQGKIAAVEEWIQGGFVSKPQALDLMEFPDTDAFVAGETSNLDLVMWQIDKLLDYDPATDEDGEGPELPIPQQDLVMAVKYANDAFLVAYRMGAPDHVLGAFMDYIAYAKRMSEEAKQAGRPMVDPNAPAALDQNAAAAAQLAQQQRAPQAMAA